MTGHANRVLVVDDDRDVATLVKIMLEREGSYVVDTVGDGIAALAAAKATQPELVITDVEMPGLNGIDLVKELRQVTPDVPVIVMTAHVSVESAVSALRVQADEYLTKPIDRSRLLQTAARLIADRQARKKVRPAQVVLAIGAHPDDAEIGVGGTLAAHAAAGDEITILTLSRGARGGDADNRQNESLAAAEMLGARLFLKELVDTEISNGGPTVRLIEEVVREVQPTVVYTHSVHDRHQDHRAVAEASLVAARRIGTIACYQSPSATIDFRPTRFVQIDQFLRRKLEMIECFASQASTRDYLDPDFIVATARYWTRFGEGTAVEPLEVVRETREFARNEVRERVES